MAPRRERDKEIVTCIACGMTVPRSAAREYDRFGNRWDRDEKRFEHMCKPCHDVECHLPRGDLETFLVTVGSEHESPQTFVTAYYAALGDQADPDAAEGA